MDTTAPVSIRVVECVAEREGIDPIELDPPLHTAIDTDALDSLYADGRAGGNQSVRVEFTYRGYIVTVEGSGAVDLTSAPATSGGPESVDARGD